MTTLAAMPPIQIETPLVIVIDSEGVYAIRSDIPMMLIPRTAP